MQPTLKHELLLSAAYRPRLPLRDALDTVPLPRITCELAKVDRCATHLRSTQQSTALQPRRNPWSTPAACMFRRSLCHWPAAGWAAHAQQEGTRPSSNLQGASRQCSVTRIGLRAEGWASRRVVSAHSMAYPSKNCSVGQDHQQITASAGCVVEKCVLLWSQ
jgi:hypothetical protein